mmetsp:Transcript_5094/g.8682  ORF Transcript_5094/g.8682 Transcript_5094/m.8682 type:complete len:238 (+) Transcript_5094:145-858(+)
MVDEYNEGAKKVKREKLVEKATRFEDLGEVWLSLSDRFEFRKFIGKGSFGSVVKVECRKTGEFRAIKHIDCVFQSFYDAKKVVREIQILRQFSSMRDHNCTTRLHDLILCDSRGTLPDTTLDFSGVFLVMEYVQSDLSKILDMAKKVDFDDEYLLQILYLMLCSLNFVHSAGILHRDIKPANLLIDEDCNVKICDFGLSRSIVPNPVNSQVRGAASRREISDLVKKNKLNVLKQRRS